MGEDPRDEAALIRRAQREPAAFGELYERYAPPVYRFIHNRVRSREVAEDLTSDTFYKVLRAIKSYRPSAGSFHTWLYMIAINTTIDYLRARRSVANLDDVDDARTPGPAVEEQVVQRSELARVRAALATLSDAQRTAVSLKLGQDMHPADIAVCMGRSEGAVKVLVHRGLAAIRRQLEPAGAAEDVQ